MDNGSVTEQQTIISSKFPLMKNHKILNIIYGYQPSRLPVWLMGQVSCYLPEVRDMYVVHDYIKICKTPELCSEMTLMPVKRFKVDAAVLFSHILLLPMALGMELKGESEGTLFFPDPLTTESLHTLDPDEVTNNLSFLSEAINLTRKKLDGKATLYGLVGAPWTLMCYMIEGRYSDSWTLPKLWLYTQRKETIKLLDMLTTAAIKLCIMQAQSGVQVIQIIETAATVMNKELFKEFCIPRLKQIRRGLKSFVKSTGIHDVPMAIYAKGAYFALHDLADVGFEIIGLDYMIEPMYARSCILPKSVCFQGNLDPGVLYSSPSQIRQNVFLMLKKFECSRLIVNLGERIYVDTPLDSIKVFIDAVREYSRNKDDQE